MMRTVRLMSLRFAEPVMSVCKTISFARCLGMDRACDSRIANLGGHVCASDQSLN